MHPSILLSRRSYKDDDDGDVGNGSDDEMYIIDSTTVEQDVTDLYNV